MAYSVGSLFCGIGGICQGFINANFNVLWANDSDNDSCRTYKRNFYHQLVEEDIHVLDPENFSKVDVITSGFPCQAFSIAGNRKGFKDSRGNLFFETIRFVEKLKPKAFLFENVKNLVNHDNGNTFRIMKEKINQIGYDCFISILNSSKHTMIPQNRERVFFVGLKRFKDFHISCNFEFPREDKFTLPIEALLEREKVDEKYYYNNSRYQKMFDSIFWKKNVIYQLRRIYIRENKSGVCPTLTANMGTGGHNVPLIKDNYGIRKLTPRECARFQGFSDDFQFPDNMSNSKLYKQIGNSVTVPLIKRIALSMKKEMMIRDKLFNHSLQETLF